MKTRNRILLVVATGIVILCAAAAHAILQPKTATALGRNWASFNWRTSLPVQFPDVGRALELSPDAVADLFDLLAKQQRTLARHSAPLLTGKARGPDERAKFQRSLVEQQRANHAELSTALGNKYPAWLAHQSTYAVRQQVESLQLQLAAGEHALREEQVISLISALTPEQVRLDRELLEWGTSDAAAAVANLLDAHMRRTVEHQRRLLAVAEAHLDRPQAEEYWRVLDRIAMREVAWTRMMGKLGTAPLRIAPEVVLPKPAAG